MDPLIQNLKSTTFFGRRLTRRQIADIQEVVGTFPKLSRNELGQTICEHLRWQTHSGRNRIQLALRLLEELERLSILTLPPKQHAGRGPHAPLRPGPRSAPQPAIAGPLAALTPLRLEVVSAPEAVAVVSQTNSIDRRFFVSHYLGTDWMRKRRNVGRMLTPYCFLQ